MKQMSNDESQMTSKVGVRIFVVRQQPFVEAAKLQHCNSRDLAWSSLQMVLDKKYPGAMITKVRSDIGLRHWQFFVRHAGFEVVPMGDKIPEQLIAVPVGERFYGFRELGRQREREAMQAKWIPSCDGSSSDNLLRDLMAKLEQHGMNCPAARSLVIGVRHGYLAVDTAICKLLDVLYEQIDALQKIAVSARPANFRVEITPTDADEVRSMIAESGGIMRLEESGIAHFLPPGYEPRQFKPGDPVSYDPTLGMMVRSGGNQNVEATAHVEADPPAAEPECCCEVTAFGLNKSPDCKLHGAG